ncbi:MAG TPA: PilZ domain-containing protein [Pyrinomonadaceae bacterium]|nr:PilZ domain-containing protein [Pyrinomonadaceae bacterium]
MEEVNKGGRERRLSPRFEVALDCRVALPDAERSSGLLFPDAHLPARTRDLSETGLGLVAASIYVGYDCVVDAGRTLLVVLEAPRGAIELKATAVHYTRIDAKDEEVAYSLGLLISEMTEQNRALYAELLRELGLTKDSNTAEGPR